MVKENIILKNINKSDWKTYRFDEIASSISERVDPTNTELEYYVGLEHLDSDSIHIKRNGTKDDVKGQKLKCYPGDVIFGKRRAYQRKAAVVEKVGLCSAHAFVLRANPDVIDPKLFPFFLHSDQFMHRAIDISVGGLSPTINWGTLKSQEFLLPPKEQQAELTELFWAVDEVIEKKENLKNKIDENKNILFNKSITNGIGFNEVEIKYKSIVYPKTWNIHILSDLVLSMSNGIPETQNNNKLGLPVTRIETISDGTINPQKIGYVNSENEYNRYKLNNGDILFSHINSIAHIGKVAIYDGDYELYHGVNLIRLKANKEMIRSKFLFYCLRNRIAKYYYERRAKPAVNQASLDQKDIGSLPIAIPELLYQDQIIKKMEIYDKNILVCDKNISSSKSLQKSLINKVF